MMLPAREQYLMTQASRPAGSMIISKQLSKYLCFALQLMLNMICSSPWSSDITHINKIQILSGEGVCFDHLLTREGYFWSLVLLTAAVDKLHDDHQLLLYLLKTPPWSVESITLMPSEASDSSHSS
jgi:hypothetical protein